MSKKTGDQDYIPRVCPPCADASKIVIDTEEGRVREYVEKMLPTCLSGDGLVEVGDGSKLMRLLNMLAQNNPGLLSALSEMSGEFQPSVDVDADWGPITIEVMEIELPSMKVPVIGMRAEKSIPHYRQIEHRKGRKRSRPK